MSASFWQDQRPGRPGAFIFGWVVHVGVDAKPIPLADFVVALRDQLRAAQAQGDPDLPVEVGPVTVEFTVLTRQEGEGHAGIRFWVVDAGASGKHAAEATQKVSMQLTPMDAAGKPLRVGDQERRDQRKPPASAERRGDVEPR
jgi:Trypsin-co-occurring domain 2